MARLTRVVIPGCPHHITQRGNLRQDIFFRDDDRRTYLSILRDHATQAELQLLAWCLMSNHVHLVAIPGRPDSMARVLKGVQGEYSRWLHCRERVIGHLWQNRYHSCPLEGAHLWEAIRYVELNPVRAGLARTAADWPWSSASAHILDEDPWGLLDLAWWREQSGGQNWEEVLKLGLHDASILAQIREATNTGRPFGSESFGRSLERETGRPLLPRRPGPKPKVSAAGSQISLSFGDTGA